MVWLEVMDYEDFLIDFNLEMIEENLQIVVDWKCDEIGVDDCELMGVQQIVDVQVVCVVLVQVGKLWCILGNQVIMSWVNFFDFIIEMLGWLCWVVICDNEFVWCFINFICFEILFNLDMWDGFLAECECLFVVFCDVDVDVVMVIGDVYFFWINDLVDNDGNCVGIEFVIVFVISLLFFFSFVVLGVDYGEMM